MSDNLTWKFCMLILNPFHFIYGIVFLVDFRNPLNLLRLGSGYFDILPWWLISILSTNYIFSSLQDLPFQVRRQDILHSTDPVRVHPLCSLTI